MSFPFLCTPLFATTASAQHALHSIPLDSSRAARAPGNDSHGYRHGPRRCGRRRIAEAQRFYDQGLAYLHNYVWIEAARSFHQALRLDSQLALAHVGLSYAYIELNKPTQARQAITTAQALREIRARSHQAPRRRARAADGGGGCAAAMRRSLPRIESHSMLRSPRFRMMWSSYCVAALLNRRILLIEGKDRSWDRFRITSA